ncbi:MAG: hypothetical protein IJ887_05805 [Prevotella sp.]|nr:hypothetical protein [Prevotella sp.]MBR6187619.1 hypothetical protein [Prevotella sp.]
MKKTYSCLVSCAICAVLTLSCCSKDNNTEPEDGRFERAVLIYMADDNNLTNYFRAEMRQVIQGTKDLATNNKLILFVDNNREKPYFMQVEKGDTIRLKSFETELKSSDPQVLYDAMKYVIDNFEAKSYGLVLWGHADGWLMRKSASSSSTSNSRRKAYGVDYTGGNTYMNIPDMAKVLERLPKLKFIFADCCCFMCVESVYELRKCADYIIGSPAEIPGEGAPYHTVVPAMFSQDSTFYKQIVDKYYEQKSGGYSVPLVAVKTSELEDLAKSTAETLQSFANDIEPDEAGCRYPDVSKLIFYYDHTQFDMQDFILRYASEAQYKEWKRVFDKAVPYHTFTTVWMANHVYYSPNNQMEFADFTITEERLGTLGMYVPQTDADQARWNRYYQINLNKSMSQMNSEIKGMQWYNAAQLSKMGW